MKMPTFEFKLKDKKTNHIIVSFLINYVLLNIFIILLLSLFYLFLFLFISLFFGEKYKAVKLYVLLTLRPFCIYTTQVL